MQPLASPIQLLDPACALWPATLSQLPDPPAQLAIQGELPDLSKAAAIVGTRFPDRRAVAFTERLAAELVQAGYVIVSGGARGIDTAAHRGALAAGGRTLAVLPTGLRVPYPPHNHPLFAEIVLSGALLAETPTTVPGYASNFLARNRLIAALATVVIVVQAPIPSGALSTAAHAMRLARPLFAVPYAPWEPLGAGCLTLLDAGARVCKSSEDVLSLAAPKGVVRPRPTPKRAKKAASSRELDEDERGVLEALRSDVVSADELCERSGLSAPRVQRAVLMLLLSKVIQEVGCGRYARLTRL